jgi:hypothetical protein
MLLILTTPLSKSCCLLNWTVSSTHLGESLTVSSKRDGVVVDGIKYATSWTSPNCRASVTIFEQKVLPECPEGEEHMNGQLRGWK